MDDLKLDKALALLQSLIDELPAGDIEEKYVAIYHRILDEIKGETGHDLKTHFAVPDEELQRQITSAPGAFFVARRGGGPPADREPTYSKERYCDRARFMIAVKGAVNYINRMTPRAERRPIGFNPAE